MKKLIIGSLVGGILVFAWQSLSWTVLNLHSKEYQKAPSQDSIISYLSSQLKDGQYAIPTADESATTEEREQLFERMQGKPWAVINYHEKYDVDMAGNIIRGLIVSLIAVFFVCWILLKNTSSSFGSTMVSTILIGLAGYLFIPYSGYIWFQNPGALTTLIDTLVAWGLCGLWLGWWLNRK